MFADDTTGGPVIDALIRAQERGVICRVLIDHLGDTQFNKPVLARLRAGNVAVQEMLPVRIFDNEWSRLDLRNHRKIVVVDGRSASPARRTSSRTTTTSPETSRRAALHRAGRASHRPDRRPARRAVPHRLVFRDQRAAERHRPAGGWPRTSQDRRGAVPGAAERPGFDHDNNLKLFVALFHAARQQITIANPYFVPDDA